MYVSSRSELTVKFKKGCKDADYFFNLQASAVFWAFNACSVDLTPFEPGQFPASDQIA